MPNPSYPDRAHVGNFSHLRKQYVLAAAEALGLDIIWDDVPKDRDDSCVGSAWITPKDTNLVPFFAKYMELTKNECE